MILSEIAGLKPYGAGFGRFILEPRFDLVESLDAKMPTNVGEIGVSWKRETEDECTVSLVKPEAACCIFCPPEGWKIESVRQNGEEIGVAREIGSGNSACILLKRN